MKWKWIDETNYEVGSGKGGVGEVCLRLKV